MSIFDFHAAVLDDYRDFVRSFFSIADDRARDYVEQALSLIAALSSIRAYQRQRWSLRGYIIADNGFADMDRSECSRQNKRRALRFSHRRNRVMIGPESGHDRKGERKPFGSGDWHNNHINLEIHLK